MKWLAAVVAVLAVLLFAGGPEASDSRNIQAIWNLGHVPLFAGLALLGCAAPFARHHSPLWLFIACTVLALVLGVGIEGLQRLVGRSFDWLDVWRDVLGVYLGLCLHLASSKSRAWQQRMALLGMGGLLLLAALQPMGLVLLDLYAMQKGFPVLANFETSRELSRWEAERAERTLTYEQVRQGRQSLRVVYLAGKFPDVTLREMRGDWMAYQYLHVSVFNTLNIPLMITIKIYDHDHLNRGNHSGDRFDREILMQPGWNDMDIALDDVKNAPADRAMDMDSIAGLSFFLKATNQPVVIYLDDIRLTTG